MIKALYICLALVSIACDIYQQWTWCFTIKGVIIGDRLMSRRSTQPISSSIVFARPSPTYHPHVSLLVWFVPSLPIALCIWLNVEDHLNPRHQCKHMPMSICHQCLCVLIICIYVHAHGHEFPMTNHHAPTCAKLPPWLHIVTFTHRTHLLHL